MGVVFLRSINTLWTSLCPPGERHFLPAVLRWVGLRNRGSGNNQFRPTHRTSVVVFDFDDLVGVDLGRRGGQHDEDLPDSPEDENPDRDRDEYVGHGPQSTPSRLFCSDPLDDQGVRHAAPLAHCLQPVPAS